MFICVKEHRIETHFVLLLHKVTVAVDFNGINSLKGLCAAEFTCMETLQENRIE